MTTAFSVIHEAVNSRSDNEYHMVTSPVLRDSLLRRDQRRQPERRPIYSTHTEIRWQGMLGIVCIASLGKPTIARGGSSGQGRNVKYRRHRNQRRPRHSRVQLRKRHSGLGMLFAPSTNSRQKPRHAGPRSFTSG